MAIHSWYSTRPAWTTREDMTERKLPGSRACGIGEQIKTQLPGGGGDLEMLWDKEMRWLQERRKIKLIIMVVILCVAYVCWENVCNWRSNENFVEFVVSFYIYKGSRNQAKVVRLVWQAFYTPSYIPGKSWLKTRWPVSCMCGSNQTAQNVGLVEMLPNVEVKKSPMGTSVHAQGQSCSPSKCSAMWTPKVVTCNVSRKVCVWCYKKTSTASELVELEIWGECFSNDIRPLL